MNSKYLNKITVITTAFALVLGLGSCKKYLDQQPITEVGPEQVFKDVPTARQALMGVYNRITGDNGYGLRLSLHFPVDNDILMGPSGPNDDRRAMAHYSLTALNADLPGPFNQLFQGIAFANIAIDNIPKMEMYNNGTEQQKAQLRRMHGEALTLRAQFYFEALRNWGDLPSHFEPPYITAAKEPFPLRVDRDIIYDRILEDLREATAMIPWRKEVTSIGDAVDERITKGVVKALRARIALFRGGFSLRQNGQMQRAGNYLDFYRIAREELNDVINSGQHSLFPDYKGLWKDIVCGRQVEDPNGELMFQVTGIGQQGIADTRLGFANGPRVGGNGNSFVNPLPNYLYLFDSTDVRRDVTIAPYDVAADGVTKIGQASGAMRDGKYRRDWIKNPTIDPTSRELYTSIKWQLLRYSDVLLMFAEVENELNGPTAAAYNAINMVRRRGFGMPMSTPNATIDIPAGLDKGNFFKHLVRERALELGAEGIRKYDLIRWNLLGTGLNEAKAAMLKIAARTGIISYSYMAPPPAYAADASNLPQFLYYRTNTTADNSNIWINSLYKPSETTAAPTGQARVNWAHSSIETGIVSSAVRYAYGYTPNKSELFPIPQPAREANPRLTQNPGY